MKAAMAVHGGAGIIAHEVASDQRQGCESALAGGVAVLESGGSAIHAVVAAIKWMESSGIFDAGRGSHLNESGDVQLDAGLMDGTEMSVGAVAAVMGVPNAILLAERVLNSEYAMLVGEGAREFAERHDVPTCSPEVLVSARERARWERAQTDPHLNRLESVFGDTVGAVALDREGNLAAGTSTGGSPGKPRGRVGDSPIAGAGYFAESGVGAASTTGHGELIVPLVWSKASVDLLAKGLPAPNAATAALNMLGRLKARGGLILLDSEGRVGVAWNTPSMAFAHWSASSGRMVSGA